MDDSPFSTREGFYRKKLKLGKMHVRQLKRVTTAKRRGSDKAEINRIPHGNSECGKVWCNIESSLETKTDRVLTVKSKANKKKDSDALAQLPGYAHVISTLLTNSMETERGCGSDSPLGSIRTVNNIHLCVLLQPHRPKHAKSSPLEHRKL